MQWILSVYAMAYNKRFHRTGHFWGERFFSRIIDSFFDYLQTFEYIDKNPLVAGLISEICNWLRISVKPATDSGR
jgi:putative transposase